MKAIILARVSSKEQEENNSIPAQTRRLVDYASRKGLEIIETFQLVESSTKENRQQYDKIIHKISSSRETLALVADTVDRLQRSFRESVRLDALRKANKVELHFVRENLVVTEKSNSADILRWDMSVLFAKSYVTQLTDNIKRSQEEKVRNGEWLSKAPFGYKNIRRDGKSWIEPDDNAPIVIEMFNKYASGAFSLRELRSWLSETYGIEKQVSQVDHILDNPFYAGQMRLRGVLHQHCYQPLITMELFEESQAVKKRFNRPAYKFAGLPYTYRGLIVCAECGCRITVETQKGHTYYHCTQYKGRHGAKYVREELITSQLQAVFASISPTEEQFIEVMDALKKAYGYNKQSRELMLARLNGELSRVVNRTERLFEAYLDGDIAKEEYKAKRNAYNAERASIERRINSLDYSIDEWYSNMSAIMELVRDAPLLFEQSSIIHQKRQLLKLVFSNLELFGKELRWKLKRPFDSMVKIKGCPSWCWK